MSIAQNDLEGRLALAEAAIRYILDVLHANNLFGAD